MPEKDQELARLLEDLPGKAMKNPSALVEICATYQLRTTEGDTWHIAISNGQVTVESKEETAECIIMASADTCKQIACGQLHPMKALLQGKVRLSGNKSALLQLRKIL